MYPISKNKKRLTKYTFSKSSNLQELTQEVSDIIDDRTVSLTNEGLQIFLSNILQSKKPSFILFYEGKDSSMSYRALSQLSKYQEIFNFASFRNPSVDVKQQFNLNKVPTLLVVFLKEPDNQDIEPRENIQVAHFSGKFNWAEISGFIDVVYNLIIPCIMYFCIVPS